MMVVIVVVGGVVGVVAFSLPRLWVTSTTMNVDRI